MDDYKIQKMVDKFSLFTINNSYYLLTSNKLRLLYYNYNMTHFAFILYYANLMKTTFDFL